jgi:hypothetical protein
MGTLKYVVLRLLGKQAEKPVNVDDADASAAPRLQHPEKYSADWGGRPDPIMREDVTPTGMGDFWPGSASNNPSPVEPHMSRRQAREWERLRAQDAERQRDRGSQ